MNSINYFFIGLFIATLCQANIVFAQPWFIESINTPVTILPFKNQQKVVIAIVDDGVKITHQQLKNFIWVNPNEVANNGVDDDGNGFIDDIHGWNISDDNSTIQPFPTESGRYYHGTHLAGIITQIASVSLGETASDYISIMPVKTRSDYASDTYLREAYQGIEYAINAGADIILTAWGVGPISAKESKILEKARKKGVLIIAAAGNIPEEKKQYPAAYPTVIAVSGLNQQDKKINRSNFGQFVDLSAPAIDIYSASVLSDSHYEYKEGTSFATAMTVAAAALVKLKHPGFSANQINVCLKTSSNILQDIAPIYRGKLGAGKLNIERAVHCPFFSETKAVQRELVKPQGYLHIQPSIEKKTSWLIRPQGDFKGLRFKTLTIQGDVATGILKIFSKKAKETKLIASYPLAKLPQNFYVPEAAVLVTVETENDDLELNGLLQYEAETIDFTKLYCKDTVHLDKEGTIEDGSGDNNYSFHSNCKWLITAPKDKVIKIKFSELDTEMKIDFIYFFDGAGTHEKIMAMFSGSELPPELTTWHNQVLVWFVTNGTQQGKGWKASYVFESR